MNENLISIYDVFDEADVCAYCVGESLLNPATLCDTHFWAWSESEAEAELDQSEDYFRLV